MMRVLVRCDASPKIGGGHAMRCLALAEGLRDRGHAVTFAMASGAEMMRGRCAAEKLSIEAISAEPASRGDLTATMHMASNVPADLVVIDGPGLHAALGPSIGAAKLGMLVLDDEGFADALPGAFVLNPNVWAANSDYPEVSPARLMLGVDHVLLRREFRAPARSADLASPVRRILITLGASDPDNFAGAVVRRLGSSPEFSDCEIHVVVGPLNEGFGDTQAKGGASVSIHRNPPNMAALMDSSDLAMSAAGGTLWELYRRGTPTLPVVIASNQRRNSEWLVARGMAARTIGDPDDAVAGLAALMADHTRRDELSRAGRLLVDGEGVSRVVATLERNFDLK